jgi:hypothetical protein
VEDRLHSLDSRITAVEAALREGNDRFRRMEIAQKDNTDITKVTRDLLTELDRRVGEPLAYFDKAMMGLRVLGGIGVAGMWLMRRWYLVLAWSSRCACWWPAAA